MKKCAALLALSLILNGCQTAMMAPPLKTVKRNSYELNKPANATVGSPMLEIYSAKEGPAVEVIEDFTAPTIPQPSKVEFRKGDVFPVFRTSSDGRLLLSGEASSDPMILLQIGGDGVFNSTKGDGWRMLPTIVGYGGLEIKNAAPYSGQHLGSSGLWPKNQVMKRSEKTLPVADVGGFRAELIYSGITGNSMRVSYREYFKDMARSSFSQDLTYNLKESDIIAFKSLKIKVIKASNSNVHFKVVEDGGLPWVPAI